MEKLSLTALTLACSLGIAQVWADDSPHLITSEGLADEQGLPSLDGASGPSLSAPAPGTLTLNDAINRAVTWHPAIREAIGKLDAQAEQVNVAKSKYYPQINAGMNNGYSSTNGEHGLSPSLVLSISQMLYDFGKVSSQVRAENAGVAEQQANVLISIDDVSHSTAIALIQVQMWQQMTDIARDQLDALSKIGSLTQQRNDEGATSMSDVVQTNARIESARSQLIQYQANLDSARSTLMSLLGWDNLNAISSDFPNKLAKSCEIERPDDRLVPAVLASWAQANVAQANLDYAHAQMMPTITLEPQVQRYLNDKYAGHETLDRTQYSAFLNVEMPLYQGGGLSARRNAAAHAVEAAQSSIERTRLNVRQKLLEARSQALNLTGMVTVLERQETLSARTRELYQQQYLDLGSRPLLDVLNAEQEVYQARFARQQTLSQLHQLNLNCLYNTGRLRNAFGLEHRTIQSLEIQP